MEGNNKDKNEVWKLILNHIENLENRLNKLEDRLSKIEGKLSIIISLVLALIGGIIYAFFAKI